MFEMFVSAFFVDVLAEGKSCSSFTSQIGRQVDLTHGVEVPTDLFHQFKSKIFVGIFPPTKAQLNH